jgi:hypothetical protein
MKAEIFRRREFLVADADPKDATFAADTERKVGRLFLNVLTPLAHEAVHRVDGALRVGEQAALRFPADEDRAVVSDRDDGGHEAVAAAIANHHRYAVLDVGDSEFVVPRSIPTTLLIQGHEFCSRAIPSSRLWM